MHPIQVQPIGRLASASNFGIGRLLTSVAAMLGIYTRSKQHGIPDYEGFAWCDQLESQVNNDIATCRRARW